MTIAILLSVLFGLSALHVYWGLGGRWAFLGALPSKNGQPIFVPGPGASFTVATALALAGILCAIHAQLLAVSIPTWLTTVGVWVLSLVFAGRAIGEFRYVGFFKGVHGTLFARRDTYVYSPLCLFTSLLVAQLALAAHQ